jgi:hypothetical protein
MRRPVRTPAAAHYQELFAVAQPNHGVVRIPKVVGLTRALGRRSLIGTFGRTWLCTGACTPTPAELPEYNAVAAIRDLTNELVDNAVQASLDAGEELSV